MTPEEHIEHVDKVQAVMRPLVHALNNRALAMDPDPAPLKIEELTLVDLVGAYCQWKIGLQPQSFESSCWFDHEVSDFEAALSQTFQNTADKIGGPVDEYHV